MGRGMKTLLTGISVAALVAVGAWFLGAAASERAVRAWLGDRSAEGWAVTYEAVDTTGFPSRFTTRIASLSLADPDTGWAWIAPEFTLEQQPWRPDQIQAIGPDLQTFASPYDRIEITADTLVADLDVQPTANWALDASRTEMQNLAINSNYWGWTRLAEGRFEMVRQETETARYDIAFSARDLTLPEDLVAGLDPDGALPQTLQSAGYTATMGFDRAWDLAALEAQRPQITHVTLDELQAQWGVLLFRATGALDVDAAGRATGQIALRAENWRQILAVAANAGVLPEAVRPTAETALGFIANLSGNPENIDATLRLEDGFVFLGPLPIGEAPRLILR